MPNQSITHSVSHQLKIALSGQRLLYAVCDKNNQILTSGERYLSDHKSLQDLLDRDDILSNIYAQSEMIVLSPKFVLAPEDIARGDQDYALFKLNNKAQADERIFRDHSLEKIEIQHAGPREFMRLIKNKFPNIKRGHIATFFIEQIPKLETGQSNNIQVFVDEKYLYLTISKSGNLLLCNSYFCSSSEDLFYFTMLAIEQLKLEPKEISIVLYQETGMNQNLRELFKNYVQNVSNRSEGNLSFVEIWNQCA